MLIKSVKAITGAMLALSALGVVSAPAQANPLTDKNTVLLSQLPGHDVYRNEPQMLFSDYAIGRVRGKVGSIVMVEFLKYGAFPGYIEMENGSRMTHIHADVNSLVEPGDDVIINLQTLSVERAHPYWLTRLKLKEVVAIERSAIDFETSAPVSLPPVQQSAPARVAPEPTPAPVRGLW